MTLPDPRAEAVRVALTGAGELTADDQVVSIDQLTGGWSRHSFTVRVVLSGGRKRAYVVRVKPAGALLDTDLGLEYRVYQALEAEPVPAPRAHAFEARPDSPFGGQFFVMEHIEGVAPNMYSRSDQAWLAQDWAGPRGIGTDMVRNLAQIHLLTPARRPTEVPEIDFAAAVGRWREVYETRHLVRDPVVEEAFDWISGRAPAES